MRVKKNFADKNTLVRSEDKNSNSAYDSTSVFKVLNYEARKQIRNDRNKCSVFWGREIYRL